jgi:hypothetical protein
MKLRVQGNAIRLRLNRREVSEFDSGGRVQAALEFPGGQRLEYSLERGGDTRVSAAFDGHRIRVRVPDEIVHDWATGDTVGIQEFQPLDGGQQLQIVIEKDFQCMHKGEGGKDPDAYPNPLAETA